jgi:hypothetical protein
VCVERRPVHRGVAAAARPGGVSAAVAEAGLVADEDLAGAEGSWEFLESFIVRRCGEVASGLLGKSVASGL